MKTIETVYNKLNNAKTELATHKVELSVASDIKKGITQGKAQLKKLDSAEKFLRKAQDTFEDALDRTRGVIQNSDFYNKQVDVVNNAEKIAKELGINPKSIDGLNELLDLMDDVNKGEKELYKLIDQKIS
jgi:phage terminase small subunit|tara:strand:- start:105 stop:494 length:390 start_codon:yes stop_codon:yes gene_type:complete